MAGDSLLPNLKPHDWPGVQQIAQAQTTMPAAARQAMRSVETAIPPGVSLLINADGKIVIPANHTQMVSIICAVAHQGHHGHVKEKAMCDTIKECFWWAGMNKDIKEWSKKCLLCIKLAGGDTIPVTGDTTDGGSLHRLHGYVKVREKMGIQSNPSGRRPTNTNMHYGAHEG